jgi:hypothetical protein
MDGGCEGKLTGPSRSDPETIREAEEEPKRVVIWGIVSTAEAEAWLTEKQQEVRNANENAAGSAEPPARTGRRGAPTPSD